MRDERRWQANKKTASNLAVSLVAYRIEAGWCAGWFFWSDARRPPNLAPRRWLTRVAFIQSPTKKSVACIVSHCIVSVCTNDIALPVFARKTSLFIFFFSSLNTLEIELKIHFDICKTTYSFSPLFIVAHCSIKPIAKKIIKLFWEILLPMILLNNRGDVIIDNMWLK